VELEERKVIMLNVQERGRRDMINIELEINGQKIKVSMEEARELHSQLDILFAKPNWIPPQPNWGNGKIGDFPEPLKIWCSTEFLGGDISP